MRARVQRVLLKKLCTFVVEMKNISLRSLSNPLKNPKKNYGSSEHSVGTEYTLTTTIVYCQFL